MSVYIKGMEMPTSCDVCPFNVFTICLINTLQEGKYTVTHSCPLIPVPDHGRLVDADALAKKMRGVVFRGEEKDVLHHNVQVFLNAPTIIPASKEDGE